jgi:biotin operon repressor
MTTLIANSPTHALETLREEYDALAGLCLTRPQIARLLGVNQATVAHLLEQLEAEGVLIETLDHAYRRRETCGRHFTGDD